jgi:hypothetical protein
MVMGLSLCESNWDSLVAQRLLDEMRHAMTPERASGSYDV